MRDNNKHKVIFRLSALGDVVLTTGVLRHWAEKYGWEFTFITKYENAPVLEHAPFIKKVIKLEKSDLGDFAWLKKSAEISDSFNGHDLIDLHRTLRSSILSLKWKGRVFKYPKSGLKRRLFNFSSSKYLEKQLCRNNVPQRYTMAVASTPPRRESITPSIYLTNEEIVSAKETLSRCNIKSGFIALHPYATHPDKAWPVEKWQELMASIEAEGMEWIVVGKDKSPLLPEDAKDFTNKLSLRETCAVLNHAEALVTGDSGPMHLAAGVGTRVIALFGPTCKAWGFYPAGPEDRVLEKTLECRPCSLHGKSSCKRDRECLKSISTDEVMKTILRR